MTCGKAALRTNAGRRHPATASPPCLPWRLTAFCWTAAGEGQSMRPRCGLQASARIKRHLTLYYGTGLRIAPWIERRRQRMANESCCEALLGHVKGDPATNGMEQ